MGFFWYFRIVNILTCWEVDQMGTYIYIYSDIVSQYINLMRKPNNGFVDTNVSY